MASFNPLQRSNSIDLPPAIADFVRLRAEFIRLYDRNHPQLQQCIKNLHQIIKTFEEDFRDSTEGSRNAGLLGISGATAVIAGIGGLVLAPFTMGLSLAVGGAVGAVGGTGAVTLTAAGFKSSRWSSEKKQQMDTLRKNIQSELKVFQDKINPVAEKMKDIQECTGKIMRDFQNLERHASGLIDISREELAELNKQMSGDMRLLTSIAESYGGFNLVLDMISVSENSRAVDDMNKLAEKPTDEEIDEREIRSKAGKFIVETRKLINQLQNIIDELEKTKDKLAKLKQTN